MDDVTVVSMIRIWNYNKSRIHSYRGARYVEISLDGTFIFKGEIRRAPGRVSDVEANYECVLFTTNDVILSLVERYDPVARAQRAKQADEADTAQLVFERTYNGAVSQASSAFGHVSSGLGGLLSQDDRDTVGGGGYRARSAFSFSVHRGTEGGGTSHGGRAGQTSVGWGPLESRLEVCDGAEEDEENAVAVTVTRSRGGGDGVGTSASMTQSPTQPKPRGSAIRDIWGFQSSRPTTGQHKRVTSREDSLEGEGDG
eukprot:gene2908-3558_t